MLLRKTVRVNEFGVMEFPPNIGETIVGKRVEIRDWYGAVRGTVLNVQLGAKGYPCALELTADNGAHVPGFSLFTTREIEILP